MSGKPELGCGRITTMGHGDNAMCGMPYYGTDNFQCRECLLKEVEGLRHNGKRSTLPEPYGYLREVDGRCQLTVGPIAPPDRAGGYATPWAAIYPGSTVAALQAARDAYAQNAIDLRAQLDDRNQLLRDLLTRPDLPKVARNWIDHALSGGARLCRVCMGHGKYQDGDSGTDADGRAPNIVDCDCDDSERLPEYRTGSQ